MSDEQKQLHTESSELEELKVKCDEYLNGWKRATADYQNLKKEIDLQKREYAEYANLKAIMEFIPIYDNLKKAAASIPEDQRKLAWVQGIAHISKQFEDALKRFDLEPIKTEGEAFNPEYHEAVSEESREGVAPGSVIREVSSGYLMRKKVVVPAKVVVAK